MTVGFDFRLTVERKYDVLNPLSKDPVKFLAEVEQPLGTVDEAYENCYLVEQKLVGQLGPFREPCEEPPVLYRRFLQLDEDNETMDGEPSITFDEDGNLNVEINWVQIANGTPVNEIVGTTPAPAPYAAALLKEQVVTNDGTLRRIKRVYVGNRTLSDLQQLRFGGKVIVRTITAIGAIPPTPVGFTLVGPGVLHPDGREVYQYEFSAAAGGGTPGTSGVISQGFTNNQGGNVAFNPADPDASTGEVICTTTAVSPQDEDTNPITQPTGFVLWAVDVEDDSGFRKWVTKASFGGGLPTGQDSDGQRDGSVIFTVSQNDADGTLIPAYPGAGTGYNIKLTHTRDNGFFKNVAVWQQLPATQTLGITMQFEKPGSAVFTGSPPQLVITAPVTLTILAEMEISYDEAQISDTPFTVESPATFYESYTPTDTGIAVTSTQALGRYLAGASGISGTNSVYNGILCDTWSATLGSSTPSSFSLDEKVLKTDNDIYLTAVDGTVVYRRTKISYDFS